MNPGPLACLSEMLTTTLSDLVMKLRNLGVYILHFSFCSTCNKNNFFYNGWHSRMVCKKLCYKILLLLYFNLILSIDTFCFLQYKCSFFTMADIQSVWFYKNLGFFFISDALLVGCFLNFLRFAKNLRTRHLIDIQIPSP